VAGRLFKSTSPGSHYFLFSHIVWVGLCRETGSSAMELARLVIVGQGRRHCQSKANRRNYLENCMTSILQE
jgi:hypothetical protein